MGIRRRRTGYRRSRPPAAPFAHCKHLRTELPIKGQDESRNVHCANRKVDQQRKLNRERQINHAYQILRATWRMNLKAIQEAREFEESSVGATA